jgi:uncharacterized protein YjbJ (UPF0337 family)
MAPRYISKPVITPRRYGKGSTMDENRISGTAKNIGGKVEEGFGRVTGDTKTQAEGIVKQVSGTAQDVYGQARDAASNMSDTARDTASSFEKLLRNTIETQPYTAGVPVTVSRTCLFELSRQRRTLQAYLCPPVTPWARYRDFASQPLGDFQAAASRTRKLFVLHCGYGHSTDTTLFGSPRMFHEPLILLVGAQGLEPWTR